MAGPAAEAQRTIERLRQIDPALRISTVRNWVPFRRAEDLEKLQEGLRRAGLSE